MVGKFILPPSNRRRLISSLMSSHTRTGNSGENFKLKSSDEFASRSKNVFEELNGLEKKHESWISHHDTQEHFEKSESQEEVEPSSDGFKKPFNPSRKRKFNHVTPGFKRHPQKWIKYTLKDTPTLSDECNKAAAMQFLDEMRKRHKEMPDDDIQTKELLFCKPEEKDIDTEGSSGVSILNSSPFVKTAHVMHECVVGKKAEKNTKVKKVKTATNIKDVKLDHLDEV